MAGVLIFDTTLRDGEQAPGASMTSARKVQVALQLDALGVDIIEAGFPAASRGDAEAVKQVARVVRNAGVTIDDLGERAGNAPLEEVVMALMARVQPERVPSGSPSGCPSGPPALGYGTCSHE